MNEELLELLARLNRESQERMDQLPADAVASQRLIEELSKSLERFTIGERSEWDLIYEMHVLFTQSIATMGLLEHRIAALEGQK